MSMQVDIWSDVACPWCYIGKRHFEAALAEYDGAADVTITWRAFELDPSTPANPDFTNEQLLMQKYGMSAEQVREAVQRVSDTAALAGLDYDLDASRPANTFDAHRLVQLAAADGLADAMVERLFAARFVEGRLLSDHAVLTELAVEVGLDADLVRDVLASDVHSDDVRNDEALAARIGIQGVPFFLVDGKVGTSGAQPPAALLELLHHAAGLPAG